MPRLSMIVAAGLALTTLGGCASGELVSSARESTATPSNLAAPAAEAPEPATTTRPVAPAAAPRSTTVTPTPTTVTPPAGADLTAVTDAKLGRLIADQNGMTVYFLTTDPTKPPASNCLGDCAALWPPVLLPPSGKAAVAGIDAKLVGRLTRPDRTIQLTLAGHPLYRFSGDTPGATLGNGLAGTAFAITPAGSKPPVREV